MELSLLSDIDLSVSPSTGQPATAEPVGWPGGAACLCITGFRQHFPQRSGNCETSSDLLLRGVGHVPSAPLPGGIFPWRSGHSRSCVSVLCSNHLPSNLWAAEHVRKLSGGITLQAVIDLHRLSLTPQPCSNAGPTEELQEPKGAWNSAVKLPLPSADPRNPLGTCQ